VSIHIKASNKLFLMTLFIFVSAASYAEITAIQQEVLDDYAKMKNMSSQQRKEFRTQLFAGKSRQQMKAYTKTIKQVKGMMPEYLGVTSKTDPAKVGKRQIKINKSAKRVAGTSITYDTGTVTGTAGLASKMLGNRFDSALNTAGTMCCFPVESSGSITMITFNMVATSFGTGVWSLYSNIMGATAVQVTSMSIVAMTGLNTLSVMSPTTANAYMNGAFLAGIFQFNIANTGLAVDSGTTGGQGFHAISIVDAAPGTALANVTTGGGGGLNAIFRVSGNVSTPVELINFTIE